MSKENRIKKRSFFDFMIYFIIKVKNDDIFALGAQLAYYLILSFFPFLIFLMTIIGFSKLDSMQIIEGLSAILPSSVFELTSTIIVEVVENQYTGLLGVSIVLSMWAASSAFRAVTKGINKAYNLKENRSFIKRAIIALICTFALAFTIVVALVLLVFGNLIGDLLISYIPYNALIGKLWNLIRYIMVLTIMICIFAGIYRYTPAKRISWREAFPGAIVSTIGWLIVSLGFSFYINNFSNYSRLYGSLGAVFVLMTWLYISSIILILGGEINSVLVIRKNNLRIK
ncbi:YihY/virulence factor BrkB family protein [Clostridium sp. NSJ-6]|uniref:YihY/virulence factor BrkB family protein n=1 Tax=Clostridium hominis TaxID=2763036 RepID=A0ABR7DG88_9CLOT|nr:YihY/virulence factor BrkB family protein [Clostridium hominis]MBC5630358.1 YihY/virulence factor BrkB family protein [Clostridium hominis]